MHSSPTRSPASDGAPRPASADARSAAKIRVLYAGNADFARAQFASEAPQLQLVVAGQDAASGSDRPAADAAALDVALVDSGSPGVNAAALVEDFRARHPGLPIVLAV